MLGKLSKKSRSNKKMTNIITPVESAGSSAVKRIAYVRNVNAQAVATTALTFESGHSLSNSMPMFAIFKHKTGTFDLAIVTLDVGAVALFVAGGLDLAAGSVATISLPPTLTAYSLSDSFVVDVTTGNTGASTFDVEIWGAKFT